MMTFPVDQLVNLTKANSQFALKLAEIARVSGEDYLRIGGKAVSRLADQARPGTPGVTPVANGAATAAIFSEIEQSRVAAVAKTKAAFDDWQGVLKDVLAIRGDSNGAIDAFQSVTQPWLKALGAFKPGTPGTQAQPPEAKNPA